MEYYNNDDFEPDLNELFMEPVKHETQNVISIQSLNKSPLMNSQLSSSIRNQDSFPSLSLQFSFRRKSSTKNEQNNIPSIPSIPTNKRKFGYFESLNGILYPLVDAYQFLRDGNVFL